MKQVHNRLSDADVKALLQAYRRGAISRIDLQSALGIEKTRFFALLSQYRSDPDSFSVAYSRRSHSRLSPQIEAEIVDLIMRDKSLVDDPRLPISGYNYSALRDRLVDRGLQVSLNTIISRAKALDCYIPQVKRKVHDRQVQTDAIGALIQHDSSLHLWSPFADDKWALITSIDDYSRALLFADFVLRETTWAHIQAAQRLMTTSGVPLRYYVDSLRVFRFVQGRDSFWRKHVLETDEAEPQWRKMMTLLGVDVTHALSPQAKGKIERPYRWMQDRVVRTCALEKLSTLDQVRQVLRQEVDRYNNRQVHSTTGEIPRVRFQKATDQGLTLFRSLSVPPPYASLADVFCLRETRTVSPYRRVSLHKHTIALPNVPPHEEVDIHMTPDETTNSMAVRIWWNVKLVHTTTLPLNTFRVHF